MNLLILLFQLQNSPGAKAAGGKFYFNYDYDCYPAAMQHAFAAGLKEIESKAIQDYNENFLNLSP
jgi:hypothetical protein